MTLVPQLIDGLPLLIPVGEQLLPAVSPDCCCDCPKTTCHDDYGGEKVITQVVFSITLPEKLYIYRYPLNPNTGEPTGEIIRSTISDFRQFSGSYIVNRAAWPDCSWTFPTATYPITSVRESFWGSCPDNSQSGTFIDSSTNDYSVFFPLGSPLNHKIRIGQGTGSQGIVSFIPEPFYPCNTSPISDINEGCDPFGSDHIIVTGTATSYE